MSDVFETRFHVKLPLPNRDEVESAIRLLTIMQGDLVKDSDVEDPFLIRETLYIEASVSDLFPTLLTIKTLPGKIVSFENLAIYLLRVGRESKLTGKVTFTYANVIPLDVAHEHDGGAVIIDFDEERVWVIPVATFLQNVLTQNIQRDLVRAYGPSGLLLSNDTYRIFTREFDEEVRPSSLITEDDRVNVKQVLSDMGDLNDWGETYNKLSPQFGELTAPTIPTTVTILMDNSGSLRGRPVAMLLGILSILSTPLERMGVKFEILGFTTVSWKGGNSRKKWVEVGRPANPGRLCDLRHLIYKTVDESVEDADQEIAVLLKEGLLKENVDGEAVEWALKRIRSRHEERKILLVITDGAPVDDSTMSVNPPNYLGDHLSQVLYNMRKRGDVELELIGINSKNFGSHTTEDSITELTQVPQVCLDVLEKILK